MSTPYQNGSRSDAPPHIPPPTVTVTRIDNSTINDYGDLSVPQTVTNAPQAPHISTEYGLAVGGKYDHASPFSPGSPTTVFDHQAGFSPLEDRFSMDEQLFLMPPTPYSPQQHFFSQSPGTWSIL